MRPDARPGPGHQHGHDQRQWAHLYSPDPAGRQVRERRGRHLAGREVRDRAHLRPVGAGQRAHLLPSAAHRPELPGPVPGPVQEPDGPDRHRHPERDHAGVPPAVPVPGPPVRARVPEQRAGPAQRGHWQQLPAAPAVHRPVHVQELHAEQAAGHGGQPELEPGHGPERRAAGHAGRRQPQREPGRHRQQPDRRQRRHRRVRRRRGRRRRPGSWAARRSRPTPTTPSTGSRGSSTSTPRWRR